jgi:HK97 family phage portal protein
MKKWLTRLFGGGVNKKGLPATGWATFVNLADRWSDKTLTLKEAATNSVVNACVNWFVRQMVYPRLEAVDGDGAPTRSRLVDLVAREPSMLQGVIADLVLYGNAFLLVKREGGLGVGYVPAERVTLTPSGYQVLRFDNVLERDAEVIHFRYGVSRTDPRLGVSPLTGALREVAADTATAALVLASAENGGVGLTFLSPETEVGDWMTEDQLRDYKAKLRYYATGDAAGTPVLLPFRFTAHKVSSPLKDFEVGKLRDSLAARVCAALGLDPMVIGLPSPNKTYSNYAEAIDAAYEAALLPLLALIENTLTYQGLPLIEDNRRVVRVRFDLSEVRALAEDEDRFAARVARLYTSGVIRRSEARLALGYEATLGEDDVYYDQAAEVVP